MRERRSGDLYPPFVARHVTSQTTPATSGDIVMVYDPESGSWRPPAGGQRLACDKSAVAPQARDRAACR